MDGRDQGWKLIGCDLVPPDIGGDDIRGKLATLGRIVIFRHVRPFARFLMDCFDHRQPQTSPIFVVSTMNRGDRSESGSHP